MDRETTNPKPPPESGRETWFKRSLHAFKRMIGRSGPILPEQSLPTSAPESPAAPPTHTTSEAALQPEPPAQSPPKGRTDSPTLPEPEQTIAAPPTTTEPIELPRSPVKVTPPPTPKIPKGPWPKAFAKVTGEPKEGMSAPRETLTLTPDTIPWIREARVVNLARVTLESGNAFLLGNMIEGDLKIAANALDKHRSEICNNLFYTNIPDVIDQQYSETVSVLTNHRTRDRIYYMGNPGGQRVYFMRFSQGDTPVILRIAVCDKAQQLDVLRVISNDSIKQIKKRGRL